jgi:phosphoribosylamine--glycine ligase
MVVGNGAREHTLVWKLRQSPRVDKVYAAPGNGGTAVIAQNLDVSATDIEDLVRVADQNEIDLTVVGPEAPLNSGIVDVFRSRGLTVFGPTQAAARLEASKVFSKALMQKYGIPHARGVVFSSYAEARDYVETQPVPIVIKADGLAAGKGVVVAASREEALQALSDIMEKRTLGAAGHRVLVEECLKGREVSLIAFTDGKTVRPMVSACDYKRVFDGDRGPNTGGMGSYSPPAFFTQREIEEVQRTVLEPTVRAMASEGAFYQGVLYAGLMVAGDGVKVLEFNVRFGDPETQVILPRLKTDLVDIIMAILEGRLGQVKIDWTDDACVGVVMASGGYPGSYEKGFPITGLDALDEDIIVFQAGTAARDGEVVTDGGRVLTVAATRIRFDGCHYRKDIAANA